MTSKGPVIITSPTSGPDATLVNMLSLVINFYRSIFLIAEAACVCVCVCFEMKKKEMSSSKANKGSEFSPQQKRRKHFLKFLTSRVNIEREEGGRGRVSKKERRDRERRSMCVCVWCVCVCVCVQDIFIDSRGLV